MIKNFNDFLITESRRIENISLKDIAKDFETGLPSELAMGLLKKLSDEIVDAIKNDVLDDKTLAKVLVWVGRNFRYNCLEVSDTIVEDIMNLKGEWDNEYPETYATLCAAFPIDGVFDTDDFSEKATKRAQRFFPWNVENGKLKIMSEDDF